MYKLQLNAEAGSGRACFNMFLLFNSLPLGPQGGSETRVSIKVVQISLLIYCTTEV